MTFFSDDDNPKKDSIAVPLFGALTISTKHPQEEAVVAELSAVLPKRNIHAPPSKHLKKATAATTSLEVHQPTVSSDNVSTSSHTRLFCV
jgi:hypothetical protein